MVKWDFEAGRLVVKQEFKRPVVYLDHWAIRRIASNQELAKRFASALEAAQGTWAVSMLNLMEFITMTDESQAAQFEDLLDHALPNLFFIEFQPFSVMDRERAMLEGGSRAAPYGDVSLLSAFAETRPETPRAFTAKTLVRSIIRSRDRLAPGLAKFKQTIVDRTQMMRDQMRENKALEKRVKGSQEGAQAQRTWLFVRELIGSLLIDRNKTLKPNDAMDLFHAVVPVAYCDLVVLDAQWKHRVNIVAKRLIEHNIGIKPADVFSGKRNGLEQFLQRLESRSG